MLVSVDFSIFPQKMYQKTNKQTKKIHNRDIWS